MCTWHLTALRTRSVCKEPLSKCLLMTVNVLLDRVKAGESGMGLTAFEQLPLLFSIFPHFSYSFSVCFYSSPWGGGGDAHSRPFFLLCPLSAYIPMITLFTSPLPRDFSQQSRHPSLRGGRRQIALLQVFAHRSLAFSFPMLVTMWKSSPANHSLALHVLHGGMGGSPSA